ncbi:MAG: MFS transporter, partial [Bacteroidetes bacterium]|nr:MFS transporter [Bacteroidota bacterium]
PEEEHSTVQGIQESAKKSALKTVAIFPVIMLVTYVILILYFRSKGGYKAVDILHQT